MATIESLVSTGWHVLFVVLVYSAKLLLTRSVIFILICLQTRLDMPSTNETPDRLGTFLCRRS